ncbi:hypothetical protein [Prevotella intermedia]|uniref:hypothetical protein n=1 Tax=Prevotella intermedia TaxID=28131 RepID=UPI00162AEA7E|nr:hypothetical protein [Prevotella intermedia]
MKKKLYIAPDIINILTETADLIMSSTDVNNNGTQVGTGSDHGGGNAWESGCSKDGFWSTDDDNNLN